MTLSKLQSDITTVCLGVDVDRACLERLGDPQRFNDYRRMVRHRLHQELRRSFKRTLAAVGEDLFSRMFDRYMAEHGPRSRFFHHIPVEFAAAMLPYLLEAEGAPAHAADLLRLEATRRAVANLVDLPQEEKQRLLPFDFEHPVVLHPTLRLLDLQHPVHEQDEEGHAPPSRPTFLAMYRPTDDARVRNFLVNPVAFDLLRLLLKQPHSMKDAVAHVSQVRKIQVDEAFLEGLCEVLSGFIEHGLLLGCSADESMA